MRSWLSMRSPSASTSMCMDTNIIFDVVVKPGCALSHEELKEIFQKAADGEGENYYVVINFDNDYAGL